ncbi:MAG: glycosyltransferase family 2 protein [Planctomycetota bacterium]
MSAPSLQDYIAKPPHPSRRQGGWRQRRDAQPAQPALLSAPTTPGEPVISIITVVYNGQATLERAVRSVLEQTYAHVEYIVIDGGSTDGTLEIIRRYEERIALWLSEPDGGIFDAMNKGLALASGDCVAILNCDDYYAPRAVAAVVEALQRAPAEAVYGDSIFVLEDIGLERQVHAAPQLTRGMTLCHPALFVARSAYARLGVYDLRYRYSADFDFALRLHHAKVKWCKVPEPLAYFTGGGAAERHLVQASWEALAILERQAGLLGTLPYFCMFLKRVLLRGVNGCIRTLFGQRAYLWVKRRYYACRGFQSRKQDAG